MPLYCWKCKKCEALTRKILSRRPILGSCCCGGELVFATNVQSLVLETLDNGVMPRRVEQIKDVAEMREARSNLDLKKGPGEGNLV